MNTYTHTTAAELAEAYITTTPPNVGLGGQQVMMSGGAISTYVTVETAQAISDTWAAIAQELARTGGVMSADERVMFTILAVWGWQW